MQYRHMRTCMHCVSTSNVRRCERRLCDESVIRMPLQGTDRNAGLVTPGYAQAAAALRTTPRFWSRDRRAYITATRSAPEQHAAAASTTAAAPPAARTTSSWMCWMRRASWSAPSRRRTPPRAMPAPAAACSLSSSGCCFWLSVIAGSQCSWDPISPGMLI